MNRYVLLCIVFFTHLQLFSQEKQSAVLKAPMVSSTGPELMAKKKWYFQIKGESVEHEKYPEGNRVAELKAAHALYRDINIKPKPKTRANGMTMGNNFIANKIYAHTPSDNTVAINREGTIVSCDNDMILYIDTNGTISNDYFMWNDFLDSNVNLLIDKYDPRIIFDNYNNRFVLVVLHAPANSNKNSMIVAYSKTRNPKDGWNIYNLPGNPDNDSTWIDFPSVGINRDELFVTLNSFGDFTKGYAYNQSVVYQISLLDGYAGDSSVQYKIWNNIEALDGYPGFTMVPAQDGWGELFPQGMHFVQTRIDTGTQLYYYYIDKPLTDPTAKMTKKTFTIPPYAVCANALIKDAASGAIDSISTGVAWVQNAFFQDSTIHFIFCANVDTGWCGLQYGKLYLRYNWASIHSLNQKGTSLCYPAIAPFGWTKQDHAAAIIFTKADLNTMPEIGATRISDNGVFQSPFTVKKGDTIVDILGPQYNQPERWGDYSGIQKHYGRPYPEAWGASSYAGNSAKRSASFNTWIAQLKTDSLFTPLDVEEPSHIFKAQLYPNLVTDFFRTEFQLIERSKVSIVIINERGQIVKSLFDDELNEGTQTLGFYKGHLPSGQYYVRIGINGITRKVEKMIVL